MTPALSLTIHRGARQIGGCAAEISAGQPVPERGDAPVSHKGTSACARMGIASPAGRQEAALFPPAAGDERVIIDLGANLPGVESPISDDELVDRVFDGRPVSAVLFTHYHGDHVGLYRRIPEGARTLIGPAARQILRLVAEHTDREALPRIDQMETYRAGQPIEGLSNMTVTPYCVDHSALDAYMFLVEAAGRRVLFTGDFRAHGILSERDRLWRMLDKYIPKGIDLLVTEGTMLSRIDEARANLIRTERELEARARDIFAGRKYNIVLVSSTNLDSVMGFWRAAPDDKLFVCDAYQARILLAAMEAVRRYRPKGKRYISLTGWMDTERMPDLFERAKRFGVFFRSFGKVPPEERRRRGFVLLARPNRYPEKPSAFERIRDEYRDEAHIVYSLWTGYLRGAHADPHILRFMGDLPCTVLHTSGHAFPEDIARLIQTADPKIIVPMHTERAEEFASLELFAPWAERVRALQDGETLEL